MLVVGGALNYDSGAGSKEAYEIDINGEEAVVTRVGDMECPRTLSNAALLPSGEAVIIGGQTQTLILSDQFAVMAAEIYNPVTKQFTTLSSMKVPRTYHASAIVMKDGRVMVAGGGLCGGCDATHRDFEIFVPPYFFDSKGELATRPLIESVLHQETPLESDWISARATHFRC